MSDKQVRFKPGRYAAIDVGTVTCRLLVADVSEDGAMSELRREHAICNLGVGVDKTHHLKPELIELVGQVIDGYAEALEELRPENGEEITVSTNATSASRDADNADEFAARLAKAGVVLQVIPGEREAALSFAGASSAFPGERVVVVDVGGGSTEIIAGEAGGKPKHAHSFNIGCRRVTERFFKQDPPSAEELAAAANWVADEMRGYLDEVGRDGFFEGRMVAVAGTATTVVSMREEMVEYDSSRVHGAVVSRSDLDALLERLSQMDLSAREKVVGLEPQRAPVIVAGLLILRQIMETAGIDAFTTSERDILHGIILDAAAI